MADEYRNGMLSIIRRLGGLGGPTFIVECKEDAAESPATATAIRSLSTED